MTINVKKLFSSRRKRTKTIEPKHYATNFKAVFIGICKHDENRKAFIVANNV